MPKFLRNAINKILSTRITFRAWRSANAKFDRPRVYYGFDHLPGPDEPAYGGIIKFQRMQDLYANSPRDYNILYLLSSGMPPHSVDMAATSKRSGAKLVWNQNGVAFPAWHGRGWEETNAPMKYILHKADHVFYQSEFCKKSADRYLGIRQAQSEILFNAVDTNVFKPAPFQSNPAELKLLLSGSHWQLYRVQVALETLHGLLKKRDNVKLIIAGRFCWHPDTSLAEKEVRDICLKLGILDKVIFRGPYTQTEAVNVMQNAHILLHTKCNDPCPGLVIEAMACGLPVVYSDSGGVPELVGENAGIGVKSNVSWEVYEPPDPTDLAEAVLRVDKSRAVYSQSARSRAVAKFDILIWLERHRKIFNEIIKDC